MKIKKNACETCILNSSSNLKKLGVNSDNYDHVIALAGNPNTGKSTIFNTLTGLQQHTGNWPGKTVVRAEGGFSYNDNKYKLVDLPGTYSLLSTSEDEEVARDFILFGKPDITLIVVDAGKLERNLSLVLQILEITDKVIVCLNLIDEAERHQARIDVRTLSRDLGVPVIPMIARNKKGISELLETIDLMVQNKINIHHKKIADLPENTKKIVDTINNELLQLDDQIQNGQWLAIRLLKNDKSIISALKEGRISYKINSANIDIILRLARTYQLSDNSDFIEAIYKNVDKIIKDSVQINDNSMNFRIDRKIDQIVTSKIWGFPIMLLLLGFVLWLTITGANYPSDLLSNLLLGKIHPFLKNMAQAIHCPSALSSFLIDGVYTSTAWVVSVMLPPMAIFFPLFTLLEDLGYLPRIAFNLDKIFKKSGAHGKQALTMSMGFGCNAAGVVATRIINSPREKLIAIITNNFSLCNGRWPAQILIATIFIGALFPAGISKIISTISVVLIVILGISFTFITSKILSITLLKGESSFFILELPPYRPPKIWQTLYTSMIDRTLIVLWRAIVFAAPAGAIIWLISNIYYNDQPIALWFIDFSTPFGKLLGLNGVILLAYIVAIPANEIVIPTVIMLTTMTLGINSNNGMLVENNINQISEILHAGGWTVLTGICLMLFSLLHNPCSTTIYTIYKETQNLKWTAIATLLPLFIGIIVCFVITQIWRFLT